MKENGWDFLQFAGKVLHMEEAASSVECTKVPVRPASEVGAPWGGLKPAVAKRF